MKNYADKSYNAASKMISLHCAVVTADVVQTVQVLTFSKGIDYCKKDSLIMCYQGNIKMCENALLSSSIFLVVPWYALIQEIIREPGVHSILDVKVRKSSFVNTVCPRELF